MRIESNVLRAWVAVAVTVTAIGCSKDESAPATTTPSSSAAQTAAPLPSAPASAPAPSASASAAVPAHDCPAGTSGDGTFAKPCEAKGTARTMEVTWTGKSDDKGPSFRVTNTSSSVILYGKIAVYFYDKAGKQLEVADASSSPPKAKPFHTCVGKLFGGVMKAGEKAVLTFSCVKKEHMPAGTTAIEAEMQMVGFTDASEKKLEYYWQNTDLTPDVRKKVGRK